MSVAAIGGAVVGGLISSSGAKSASKSQERAAAQADATQRYMYDQTRTDNAPFRETGVAANNRLGYLLGIGSGGASSGSLDANALRQQLLSQYTKTSRAASPPTNDDDNSAFGYKQRYRTSSVIDEKGLNATINSRLEEQARAKAAADAAQANDPAYGSLTRRFDYADLENDVPFQLGHEYAQQQGQTGVNRLAAASGMQLSGPTLKALQRSGANIANQYAGDARNRYVSDQDSTYNKLAGVSGAGQVATAQVGAAGANAANQISNNQIGLGNARGASAIAQGNALSGAIGQGVNAFQQQNFLGSLNNQKSGFNWAGMGGFGDSYSTSYGE